MNTLAAVAEKLGRVGKLLVAEAKVEPGMDVLDVATGTGNVAVGAGKEGARVTAIDPNPELIEIARERAADNMLEVEWKTGPVDPLPFEDASFDRVLSAFGSLYAPRPERAASELVRVCRPGGAVGICNWTPAGVGGRMYAILDSEPMLWGDEEQLRDLFGERCADLRTERRTVSFSERSPQAWLEFVAQSLAPFEGELSEQQREGLLELFTEANTSSDGGLQFEQEYLLAVARL